MERAAHALEWTRFLALAEEQARTEPGKLALRTLSDPEAWARDLATAQLRQHETQEVLPLLARESLWDPLSELLDPASALDRLGRGAVLEVSDLALLRRWLYAVDSWAQVPREEIRGELVRRAISQLPDPFQPLRVLEAVLTPEGELSEKASPKLAALHGEIRSLKREIGAVLDQLMKTFAQKGVLQENFTDVRDGRYVLPVKISNQSDVDGIIYEASASRQTVFVEPREVAPLNNRLRQRQNDLAQEIFVVLSETARKLAPFQAEIALAVQILTHWDQVQARARHGRHYAGKPIQVVAERRFFLRQTAHPLLWWAMKPEQIIRNEVDFGEPTSTLLITGPNTGGKTVLLKTLGMAGICARTGFPFPAVDQPVVPFFESFFADLGDPQSIEEHLSSFSGHVLRFKDILNHVSNQSLVLMDELNSATDPDEGAALGQAFLETVMGRGALIVATTHDPHLKAAALSDTRIMNASMAFDESSRTPTYRLVQGVPGRSRALETAERLGIPSEVLDLAKKYLSREHLQFETLLAKLETDAQETARARREAVTLREEAEKLKKEWTERTEASVGEMMERTRQRLRRILEQAQDEVRSAVRKLDEAKSRKDLDQTRAQINEAFSLSADRLETALEEEAPEIARTLAAREKEREQHEPKSAEIAVGTQVRIPKWKATGTVLEVKGNKAKVAMGTIQMQMSLSDIEALSKIELNALNANRPRHQQGPRSITLEATSAPPATLDLRGIRFEEAMVQLEKYLDQAFRSGALAEATIIHGLGSGALREGTRKVLKGLPYIKEYRDGGIGMGGAGATIVEFERD